MVTYDCFLDTHVLADLLLQYNSAFPNNLLEPRGFLSERILQRINPLIESEGRDGVVLTSVFNIVEILNKLTEIYKTDSSKMRVKLYGFLKQTPDWFIIEEMNINTADSLIDVPIKNLKGESISGDDAILVATALQRGRVYFCTFDTRLDGLKFNNVTFIR